MNTCVNGRTSPHILHTLLAGAALVWNNNGGSAIDMEIGGNIIYLFSLYRGIYK
jgi:hypothetical protein